MGCVPMWTWCSTTWQTSLTSAVIWLSNEQDMASYQKTLNTMNLSVCLVIFLESLFNENDFVRKRLNKTGKTHGKCQMDVLLAEPTIRLANPVRQRQCGWTAAGKHLALKRLVWRFPHWCCLPTCTVTLAQVYWTDDICRKMHIFGESSDGGTRQRKSTNCLLWAYLSTLV